MKSQTEFKPDRIITPAFRRQQTVKSLNQFKRGNVVHHDDCCYDVVRLYLFISPCSTTPCHSLQPMPRSSFWGRFVDDTLEHISKSFPITFRGAELRTVWRGHFACYLTLGADPKKTVHDVVFPTKHAVRTPDTILKLNTRYECRAEYNFFLAATATRVCSFEGFPKIILYTYKIILYTYRKLKLFLFSRRNRCRADNRFFGSSATRVCSDSSFSKLIIQKICEGR